eukprot:1133611-Karenia_brevis.AAC.1
MHSKYKDPRRLQPSSREIRKDKAPPALDLHTLEWRSFHQVDFDDLDVGEIAATEEVGSVLGA